MTATVTVTVTPPLAAAWLRRVARSPHADRLVLRGSLLTAQWVPERPAADVDHVLVPEGTPADARAIVDEVLAEPDDEALPPPVHEVIWAETPWPGHRTKLGDLQIDVGSGDPLAMPATRIRVAGADVVAVRPEQMFGWKVHGLVELGHGKWKPKDLYDLLLLDRHCPLDDDTLTRAIALAFTSRNYDLALLDRLLYTNEWGRSRGSRRKWLTFQDRWRGPISPPDFETVVTHVRTRLRPLAERAKALCSTRSR
ncbi:MAG: nucleotidyl transferase AbiEii/AbiGii toxin family protein [Labilithrix sp.]|nr:nucleotidyl transferase AbiEii/AbiGii toxin family protein [Labilithrix sp.]MCW5814583.1 nucleotidyl transferase AbiEii/AbiGii toxin family protein [Labilithrix sp.]